METKLTVMHCSVSLLQHNRTEKCIISVSQEVILLPETEIDSPRKFDVTYTKHSFDLNIDLNLSLQCICMSNKNKHSVNKDQRK